MTKYKANCWETMNCQDKEKCPAYPIYGTLCFSIKGTLCRGEVQGDYQAKIERCRSGCKHYEALING